MKRFTMLVSIIFLLALSNVVYCDTQERKQHLKQGYVTLGLGVWGLSLFCTSGIGYCFVSGAVFAVKSFESFSKAIEEDNIELDYAKKQ